MSRATPMTGSWRVDVYLTQSGSTRHGRLTPKQGRRMRRKENCALKRALIAAGREST